MANQNPLNDRDWLHVKQQFKRYVRREEYRATLGDSQGTLDEPGYPGYVRVRYSQQEGNLSQPTTLPFEANMIKQVGAAVIVGYDDNGDLAVLRPDVATQRTQGINTLGNNASDPNVTYYIGQQRIITLNSHPISSSSASMVVTIQNWLWIKGGVVNYFTGGDGNEVPIDLTSFIPGSPNMECLACLFIKPDNSVEIIASTPKNAAIGVDIADIQECLDGSTTGGFPVWAWRLYHGQMGIAPGDVPSGGDDFLDLRQFINVVMDSVGGSLTVTDGSTTVTDVTDITFNGSDFTVTDLGSGAVQVDVISAPGSQVFPIRFSALFDEVLAYDASNTPIGLTLQIDTLQALNYYCYQSSVPADGCYFTTSFLLAAGTYTCYAIGVEDVNRGILDWELDGASQTTGQDWAIGSTTRNVVKSFPLTVLTDGYHVLKGTINGKNIGSIGYYFALSKIWCLPSAD